MAQYKRKETVVEATQWFKNGDHPDDACHMVPVAQGEQPFLSEGKIVRRYRNPMIRGDAMCAQCSRTFDDHGFLDFYPEGQKVCPGDFVCADDNGRRFAVRADLFAETYEPVEQ